MGISPPSHPSESTWKSYLKEIERRTALKLRDSAQKDIEDCSQSAAEKLHRYVERAGLPHSAEGLIEVIVRRTVASHLRRKRVERRIFSPIEISDSVGARDEIELREIEEEVAWKAAFVLGLFQKVDAKCLPLAEARSSGEGLKRFAERVAVEHAAVRKRWQRCVERLHLTLKAMGVHWGVPKRQSAP